MNKEKTSISIDRDGVWRYGETPIERMNLVRLFYSALQQVDDEYYIVTPVERVRVDVEDAPYCVYSFTERSAGEFVLLLNDESSFILDETHPLRLNADGILYVLVRNGLEARFNFTSFSSIGKYFDCDESGRFTIRVRGGTMIIDLEEAD